MKTKKLTRDELLGDAIKEMAGTLETAFDFAAYANEHIFNKLSETSDYGFYYSPYGYFFRHVKWGGINELGFRIKQDWTELREDRANYLMVNVYGGSTAFDIMVSEESTFCALLEKKLNADDALRSIAKKPFRVVNLGQPGNMLLNQVFNHILFGAQLEPRFVICHNPVNDFATSQNNDPKLLSKYNFNYCDILETWARKLHSAEHIDIDYLHVDPKRDDFSPARVRTNKYAILKAYHYRVRQFCQLVGASGAAFINGFQPWITAKKDWSANEQRSFKGYRPYYKHIYANVPEMYVDYLYGELFPDKPGIFVNFHEIFAGLSPEIDHFADICHLLPAGNEVVATEYYAAIKRALSDAP